MTTDNATNATTGTATKKAPRVYVNPDTLTGADKEAFDKLSEFKQQEYRLLYNRQEENKRLAELRKQNLAEQAQKKADRDRETGVKAIIKDVKDGVLVLGEDDEANKSTLAARLTALGIAPEDFAGHVKRIKEDSVKQAQTRLAPIQAAYTLTHRVINVLKDELIAPTDGSRPDNTLANSVRKFGMLSPILVRVAPSQVEGVADKYAILDGRRRFYLCPDNAEFAVLLVTGFPDDETAEKAEVISNRVRSLNALATADALDRFHTRGLTDTQIRQDMGFKTGEIDKIISINRELIPALRNLLRDGSITASVGFAIAKLPANLQEELLKGYNEKKALAPATTIRISEADVNAVRQSRAADAAKRDNDTLAGLSGAANDNPGDGSEVSEAPVATETETETAQDATEAQGEAQEQTVELDESDETPVKSKSVKKTPGKKAK